MPPLPHHRAYGSVPRRFGGLSTRQLFHGDQTETSETDFGEGAMQSFGEAQPPGSLGAEDGRTDRAFGDLEPAELTIALASRLPLDPGDATQAPSDPAIQRWQLTPLAEAEVPGPTPHERVQVGNHLLQADAPMPPGQFANPVFEPGHGLVGDASPERRVILDREAEERAVPRPSDGTLRRVDLQLEASFDEAGQARHDPPTSLFAADVDVTVIRVSHEPVAATLKLAIQFIQHEIREQWREWTAPCLRRGRLCGVPSRLSSNSPLSSTPAVRYPRISRRTRRSETRAATAASSRSWLTRSKNLARSMSTTNR